MSEHEDYTLDELAGIIKPVRKSLGLSQEQMSFELGFDQSGLSKLERGAANITNYSHNMLLRYFEEKDIDFMDWIEKFRQDDLV